jgi:hypothetical protein
MSGIDSLGGCCRLTTILPHRGTACGEGLTIYNAANPFFSMLKDRR